MPYGSELTAVGMRATLEAAFGQAVEVVSGGESQEPSFVQARLNGGAHYAGSHSIDLVGQGSSLPEAIQKLYASVVAFSRDVRFAVMSANGAEITASEAAPFLAPKTATTATSRPAELAPTA